MEPGSGGGMILGLLVAIYLFLSLKRTYGEMAEICENVKVFARRCLRQRRRSYDNTTALSSKTGKLKINSVDYSEQTLSNLSQRHLPSATISQESHTFHFLSRQSCT